MALLIATVGAVSTFFFVILTVTFYKRSKSVDIFNRLRRHHLDETNRKKNNDDIFRRVYKFIQKTAQPLDNLNIVKNFDFKLKQAGIPIFAGEFIIIGLLGSIFGAVAGYIITLNINAIPIGAMLVPVGSFIFIKRRINKRRQAFTEQLGDCLTTVANALRAGYSFQQAMDVVAREMEPPMSTEFERVSTDVAMGVALEDSLEQMNRRIGSADFDLVVTAVLIQREIGGNLAQILDTISFTINERIRMKREIKALTAQGRFSAWVLVVLPFIVAAFCWVFNNEQMQLFITEPYGRIAIAVAIIMEILGFIIIQKIVDIDT